MKRKLLSILTLVLSLSMAVSAFFIARNNMKVEAALPQEYDTPIVLTVSDLFYKSNKEYVSSLSNESGRNCYVGNILPESGSVVYRFKYNWDEKIAGTENLVLKLQSADGNSTTLASYRIYPSRTEIQVGENTPVTGSNFGTGTSTVEFGRLHLTSGEYYYYLMVNGSIKVETTDSTMTEANKTSKYVQIRVMSNEGKNSLESAAKDYEAGDELSVSDLKYESGKKVGPFLYLNTNETYSYVGTAANYSSVLKFKYHVRTLAGPSSNRFRVHFFAENDKWNQNSSVWFVNDATFVSTEKDQANAYQRTAPIASTGVYDVEISKLAIMYNSEPTGYYQFTYKIDGTVVQTSTLKLDVAKMAYKYFFNATAGGVNYLEDVDFENETWDADHITLSNLNDARESYVNVDKQFEFAGSAPNFATIVEFELETNTLNGKGVKMNISGGPTWSSVLTWIQDQDSFTRIHFAYPMSDKPIDVYNINYDGSPMQDNETYHFELGRVTITSGKHAGMDLCYIKINGEYIHNNNFTSIFYAPRTGTCANDCYRFYMKNTDSSMVFKPVALPEPEEPQGVLKPYDTVSVSNITSGKYTIQNVNNKNTAYSGSNDGDISTVFTFYVDFGNASTQDASFEMNLSGQVATGWQGCRLKFDGANRDRIQFAWLLSGSPVDYYYFNKDQSNILDNTLYKFEFGRITVESGPYAGYDYVYLKVNDEFLTNGDAKSRFYHEHSSVTLDERKVCITSLGCAKIMDINYPTETEEARELTVNDLMYNNEYQFGRMDIKADRRYTYTDQKANGSVIYRFTLNANNWSVDSDGFQIHFNNAWVTDGLVWIRPDAIRIGYTLDASTKYQTGPAITAGNHDVETGKLAILNNGTPTGEYLVYVTIDGIVYCELITNVKTNAGSIYITGRETNNNTMSLPGAYDANTMDSATVDAYINTLNGASIRLTDPTGIRFATRVNYAGYNQLVSKYGIENVELYTLILPRNNYAGNTITLKELEAAGLRRNMSNGYVLIEATGFVNEETASSDGYYMYYGSLVNIKNSNINRDFYGIGVMKVGNKYFYGDTEENNANHTRNIFDVATQAYESASESQKTVLEKYIGKTLNVSYNGDTEAVSGASKSGDMGDQTIVLTGSESSYGNFILNGQKLANNTVVEFGVYRYKATLGANTITLALQQTPTRWGVSDHFRERTEAYSEWMTKENVYTVMNNVGLDSLRLDIYFSDIFYTNSDNTVRDDNTHVQKVRTIIDYMTSQNPNMEIMAVVWVTQPLEYRSEITGDFVRSIPTIGSDAYNDFITLNKNAMRRCAELFPEITAYEVWNEPQFKNQIYKYDGTPFTLSEVARVLTDLCYNYTEAVKSVSSNNKIVSPSLITGTNAQVYSNDQFYGGNVQFLEALYQAIKDSTKPALASSNSTNPDDYFEAVTIHPYCILGITKSNWTTFVNSIHEVCRRYGDTTTPLWLTEFGIHTGSGTQSSNTSTLQSMLQQAYDAPYIDHVFFYKGIDQSTPDDTERYGLYNQQMQIKYTGTAAKNFIASHR